MDNNVNRGIFLGYTATSSWIYYWNMDTKMVNTSKNVRSDELMNDLEIPTPNYRQLRIALGRPLP